ncbi:MAG: hypothetical protein GX921_02400, partial [Bacteroidales bacterium]|nr:hypothetical protein [Bacteroidales bacterium]
MKNLKTILSVTLLLVMGVTSCTFTNKQETTELDYPIESFTSVNSEIVANIE